MNKILEKLKSMKLNGIKKFLFTYKRYIGAGALFIILLIVVLRFTGNGDSSTSKLVADSTESELYSVDVNDEINTLISNYYTYYAEGDVDSLATIATPLSDKEKSYISMYSEYIESYQNLVVYTKSGLTENSYLVSVDLDIKFVDVDTLAPGLDFFYVEMQDDGTYIINNLYSQFNTLNQEQETDSEIEALIETFENQDDVIALQTAVQAEYEAAIESDEALATMINTTIYDAYTAWAAAYTEESTEATAEAETETTTETTEETTTAETTEESDVPTTLYTTTRVNVRDAADASGNLIATVDAGTEVTLVSDMGNGWYNVTYNGTNAYILSEYLTSDSSSVSTTTTTTTATSGETVTLTQACKVRSSMSADSSSLGTAYAGETVTIVEAYAEGWTKVTWNGTTGYIRSDLLP